MFTVRSFDLSRVAVAFCWSAFQFSWFFQKEIEEHVAQRPADYEVF